MASRTYVKQSNDIWVISLSIDRATIQMLSLVTLLVVAAFLRLYQLGAESFWTDEVTMMYATHSGMEGVMQEIYGGRPSLFVILGYHWLNIFGTTEFSARLLSVVCGTAAVMALYQVGKELFNHRVGFIAAIIMTFVEFHVYQSQNYRYYAVYMIVMLLSFLYLNRFLRTGKKIYLIPYVAASILTFYAHGHGMLVVFGQGVFFLLQIWRYRPRIVYWIISEIVIFAGILPGLFITFRDFFSAQTDTASGMFTPATWIDLPTPFSLVRSLVRFIFYTPNYINFTILMIAIGFIVAFTWIFIRHTGFRTWLSNVKLLPNSLKNSLASDNKSLIFVLCWFIFPLILPFALSFIVAPMYVDRYVLAASPAFYLLIAFTLYQFRRIVPEAIIVGALLIMLIPGLYTYYYQAPVNEQWRDIAAYLEQNEHSNDVLVIASNDDNRMMQIEQSLDWYYRGNLPQCTIREDMTDDIERVQALEECIQGYDRVWVTALRWNGDAAFFGKLPPFFAGLDQAYNVSEHRSYTKSVLYLFEPAKATSAQVLKHIEVLGQTD